MKDTAASMQTDATAATSRRTKFCTGSFESVYSDAQTPVFSKMSKRIKRGDEWAISRFSESSGREILDTEKGRQTGC